MDHLRSRIIKLSGLTALVVLIGVLVLGGQTVGTTFANGQGQGGLELTIDSTARYNGELQPALTWALKDLVPGVDQFFYFTDVKPGDVGEHTISVHVDKSPAYVCLDFINLVDDENGTNEPEALVDTKPGGELSGALEFFAWRDDGDNLFAVGEEPLFGTDEQSAVVVLNDTSYPLADATTGTTLAAGSVSYVGVVWCAGDLSVDLETAAVTCDPTAMGNEAQTDTMTLDVSLRAVAANQQRGFQCIPDECAKTRGNNGHGNDADGNDDSNPGNSNDPNDMTDDDGVPPGQSGAGYSNKLCRPQGNNGHGNDADGNDDSNPGNSNDPADDTDDDGFPPGQVAGMSDTSWQVVEPKKKSLLGSWLGRGGKQREL